MSVMELNNLERINGIEVRKSGEPIIVETELGHSIDFNGIDQGIVLEGNPLNSAAAFTIEVVFKPELSYPENIEQRFLHIQNKKNENSRVLIELRLTDKNEWFLDTFIRSDDSSLALYADKYLHPVGSWYHAALVYNEGAMKHFVNGAEELSGRVQYMPIEEGEISIGMRMNKVSWFKGKIRSVRLTPRELMPEEFMTANII